MKVIDIKVYVKDGFKSFIRYWPKIDDNKFDRNIIIEMDNEIVLEYSFLKESIAFGTKHKIYSMTDEEIKEKLSNEFKEFSFLEDEESTKKLYILKKLHEIGYEIIPLEDKFYIKSEENICIKFFNDSRETKDII